MLVIVLVFLHLEGANDYQKPREINDIDEWMELEGKNPVSILNELYPATQYISVASTVRTQVINIARHANC